MPDDYILQHVERLTKVENEVKYTNIRLDGVNESVDGLASKIDGLTKTLSNYKIYMIVFILLLASDNQLVVSLAKKILGL